MLSQKHQDQIKKVLKTEVISFMLLVAAVCKKRECFVLQNGCSVTFIDPSHCTFKALCFSPERIPVLSLFQLCYGSNAVQPTAPLKTRLDNSDMFSQNCSTRAITKQFNDLVNNMATFSSTQTSSSAHIPHVAGFCLVCDNQRSSVLLQQLWSDPAQRDPQFIWSQIIVLL